MLIIGDVHGKVDEYWKIIQKHKGSSIQVGDLGFKKQHEWHLENMDNTKHKINFGNHDDYGYLDSPHSLGNYSYDHHTKLMTIRGAFSIDKEHRVEGISWWANEEMNYSEMQKCIEMYEKYKPQIVVSHDCPNSARIALFQLHEKSITSNGLQACFEANQPALWVFGHHHKPRNQEISGCRFICLAELQTFLL